MLNPGQNKPWFHTRLTPNPPRTDAERGLARFLRKLTFHTLDLDFATLSAPARKFRVCSRLDIDQRQICLIENQNPVLRPYPNPCTEVPTTTVRILSGQYGLTVFWQLSEMSLALASPGRGIITCMGNHSCPIFDEGPVR